MRAELIPLHGDPIRLESDVTVVGRNEDVCDLVLSQAAVSKMHCIIVKTDGLLYVRDLGSTNGTKVNGQRITRGALLPGDELGFASVKYRVHLGPDDGGSRGQNTTADIPLPPVPEQTGSATPA
ncbi:FHA domain protein [Stratiformator vulcanicus]|uniref:FHA domain protein n=2 Tax=Stratiformator vulcanicus TaxID=2527980 RepID=A0A517QYL0_9PLAN|nr:FHA domain protein [Stratiformator vulcanicus]